jgi:hypothetical protein
MEGTSFTNIHTGKVLDVSGGKDREGQSVIVWKKTGGTNQRWTVRYVDQMKKDKPVTGTGKEGFKYTSIFYIRSRLPM